MALEFTKSEYFHAGRAGDLANIKDRRLYRFFEILPGGLSWATLVSILILAKWAPVAAAIFVIVFDTYWLLKTIYLSIFLRQNWKRIKNNIEIDWKKRLSSFKYEHIYHLVILPFYKEEKEVIEKSLKALLSTKYDKNKILVVLAGEERAGPSAANIATDLKNQYASSFGAFITTIHPADILGEMAGKGSNISFAAKQAKKIILEERGITMADVIVSAFDIDTVIYPKYFECLTWHFLTVENPYRTSFQPVPFYNNNIWQSPALSRVVATSGTFWQMIQQERPERLATFSSHAISFKTLDEIDYWQTNMVSEDSRIFWNAFVAYDGNYSVVPLSYPVSMDANLAPTFMQTSKNIYKQQRRWTWGVENVPYILMAFTKNKAIPRNKKWHMAFVQLEGFWSLATNPLIIFLLGWLPLWLGGYQFNTSVLSYNLPIITRNLMNLAMLGLFLSAIISMSILPKPPEGARIYHKLFMVLQWLLVPVTIILFGAIPGLDAQTRLMFKKYMGFWVTPKYRK